MATPTLHHILCRDREGVEHHLQVTAHASLIAIEGVDDMMLVLHPGAAIELALALIIATKGTGQYRGIVGPISGPM